MEGGGHKIEIQGKAARDFEPFITTGAVRVGDGRERDVAILRDTGTNPNIVLKSALEGDHDSSSGVEASVSGLVAGTSLPLHYVNLKSSYVNAKVLLGVSEKLPIEGVDMLLGNDNAGSVVVQDLQTVDNPLLEKDSKVEPGVMSGPSTAEVGAEEEEVFLVCVVTTAMALKGGDDGGNDDCDLSLSPLFDNVNLTQEDTTAGGRDECEGTDKTEYRV